MNTKFDLSITSQSTIFFENLQINASKKLIDFSREHTNIARFIGLPIALCCSLLKLAEAVSSIGESLIKGVANIFGSPFSEKCSFSKGAKQIFVQVPLKLINSAVGLSLGIAIQILVTPIRMIVAPTSVLESIKKIAEEKIIMINIMFTDQSFSLPQGDPTHAQVAKYVSLAMKHTYT